MELFNNSKQMLFDVEDGIKSKAIPETKISVLFVTNMFPCGLFPVFGIFVKEQMDDLIARMKVDWDLVYINAREKGKLAYIKSVFHILDKVKKHEYDIIHIHYGLSALFLLFFKPKSKVFLTLHGADILIKQGKKWQVFLTKKILRRVDKVFVLNKEMEEIAQTLGVNYEVLPCGVNIDFFKPNGQLKKEEKSKLVVFPSSPLVGVKNFPLFEKVIQLLRQKSDYTVEFACIQNLTRAEVRDLLNRADCLLMTSTSEGSPQVIKEALACGLPVVSVPVGDVPSMMEEVPHCYVATSYAAAELCQLVLEIFEGKQNAFDIRNAFINKKIYDSHSVTRRLVECYREAASI